MPPLGSGSSSTADKAKHTCKKLTCNSNTARWRTLQRGIIRAWLHRIIRLANTNANIPTVAPLTLRAARGILVTASHTQKKLPSCGTILRHNFCPSLLVKKIFFGLVFKCFCIFIYSKKAHYKRVMPIRLSARSTSSAIEPI